MKLVVAIKVEIIIFKTNEKNIVFEDLNLNRYLLLNMLQSVARERKICKRWEGIYVGVG